MSIVGFRHKGLERLFVKEDTRGVPAALAPKIRRMLFALDNAAEAAEMALYPGWRLHALKGDLSGFWSVTVTGNLRIVFRLEQGEARDVDLVDYH
jgi:proteic killer suppression protein